MRRLRLLAFLCVFSGVPVLLALQTKPANSPGTPSTASASSPGATEPSPSESAPSTVVEYAPSPEQYARAKAYSNARYRHFFINALYSFLVLLVLLQWRIGPAFRNCAERVSRRRSVQVIVFAPLILLTLVLLEIPSDIWDQSLMRAYGLSVQAWGPWLRDWILNQVPNLIVGTLLIAILYAGIRHSPRRWWFYFWLASIPVLLALFFCNRS